MIRNKRRKKYKRYARTFCDRVRNDYEKFRLFSTRYPEMRFYTAKGYTTKGDFSYCDAPTQGDYTEIAGYCDAEKGYIEIYNFTKEKPDRLKRTIRHECLHFILGDIGLPNTDDDTLFLLLAIKYNADPYEILKPDVKERLETMMNEKGGIA